MQRNAALGLLAGALVVSACATKVLVPPAIDLRQQGVIGLIQFSSNAQGNLDEYTAQKFLHVIQAAQPGVRVLELGSEQRVLDGLGLKELDFEAIQAIGAKHGVDSVFTGDLEITEVRPKVQLSSLLTSMSVEADVGATLSLRLQETQSGATIWTRSVRGKKSVAQVKLLQGKPASFGASDPESAYGRLVGDLVYSATHDMRSRYERR